MLFNGLLPRQGLFGPGRRPCLLRGRLPLPCPRVSSRVVGALGAICPDVLKTPCLERSRSPFIGCVELFFLSHAQHATTAYGAGSEPGVGETRGDRVKRSHACFTRWSESAHVELPALPRVCISASSCTYGGRWLHTSTRRVSHEQPLHASCVGIIFSCSNFGKELFLPS